MFVKEEAFTYRKEKGDLFARSGSRRGKRHDSSSDSISDGVSPTPNTKRNERPVRVALHGGGNDRIPARQRQRDDRRSNRRSGDFTRHDGRCLFIVCSTRRNVHGARRGPRPVTERKQSEHVAGTKRSDDRLHRQRSDVGRRSDHAR